MMTSDDKVGGWVKKGQNHDDVILECPLMKMIKHILKDWMLRKKGNSLKEKQRLLSTKTLDWLKGELKKI